MRQDDPKAQRLATADVMHTCTAKELARVAAVGDEIAAPAGTQLCHQGGAGHHCYVVLEGDADVIVDGQVVGSIGPGEIVGELSLLDRGRRSATVVTRTPARLVAISASDLDGLMDLGGFRRGVMRQVVRRLRGLDRTLAAGR